jgi:tripartite-type tricarboxylate transporter receptor subunit TctC
MANITRRELMISAGMAAPALLTACDARDSVSAADYPERDIQFVIPYAPGGGFDIYVRLVAPVMEKYLPRKVSIVPLNVASGAGSRGVAQAYRARPDGYTMTILNIPGMFILQAQQGTTAFDLNRFPWIGAMGEGEKYFISVGQNSPLKTFDDLKQLSAQRPVKLSVTGPEGTAYMAAVVGSELMGLRTQLITGYRGSADYVVAAVRGDSDAVVAALPTTFRFRRGGQLRPLASFETTSSVPGIPDATSLGKPELDLIRVERLVAAPPGTPPEAVNVLSTALAKALVDPVVVKWAAENDVVMKPKTPQEAVAILNEQRAFFEKWKPSLTAS